MNVNNSERIEYIDLFKSFGIILMIFGHLGFGDTFDKFIHAFHMPMFFWISGYLFGGYHKSKIGFVGFIKKKAKSLLLPYISFVIVIFTADTIVRLIAKQPVNLDLLVRFFTDNRSGLGMGGPLWFLTALFFAGVFFYLIDRFILNKFIKVAVIVIVSTFGTLESVLLPFNLPLSIGIGCTGVGLIYLGYLFGEYKKNKIVSLLTHLNWLTNTVLAALTVALIFLNNYVNMKSGKYDIIPLFWINALLGTLVLFNYARLLYPFVANNFIGRYFCGIGRDSIVYLCVNLPIVYPIAALVKSVSLPIYIEKIIDVVLVFVILWLINKLIQNTKLRYLFGKW